jgi:hypothetical protein
VMQLDIDIHRVKGLIAKREEIDVELAAIFGGQQVTRRAVKCSVCNAEGHTARTCPAKQTEVK